MSPRRFPPPWSVEERPACFVVRDQNGQQLAYVYFEEEGAANRSKYCEVPRVFEKAAKIAEHLLWREHGELLLEGARQEPSIGLF